MPTFCVYEIEIRVFCVDAKVPFVNVAGCPASLTQAYLCAGNGDTSRWEIGGIRPTLT
jgi:hypothetical protein